MAYARPTAAAPRPPAVQLPSGVESEQYLFLGDCITGQPISNASQPLVTMDDSGPKSTRRAPQVNWSTYPKECNFQADASRASVRSCNASFETSMAGPRHRSRYESGPPQELRRSVTPNELYTNADQDAAPPPRPPKPANLRFKSKSESCSSLPSLGDNYDIPQSGPPAVVGGGGSGNRACLSEFNKSPVARLPQKQSLTHSPAPPQLNKNLLTVDTMYDFPRPDNDRVAAGDKSGLNTIPKAPKRSHDKQHSYSNAATGFVPAKHQEPYFIYEDRALLPTTSDDHFTGAWPPGDRSPRTPNSGLPPAVNRDLKPRRKNSDSDTSASNGSPTTPNRINLLDPPVRTAPRLTPRKAAKPVYVHTREASLDDNIYKSVRTSARRETDHNVSHFLIDV